MDWLVAIWAWLVEWWPVFITAGLPFVVSAIATCSWSARSKSLTALVLSFAVGLIGALTAGLTLTPETLAVFTLTVFGGVKLSYELFRMNKVTNRWLDLLLEWGSVVARE